MSDSIDTALPTVPFAETYERLGAIFEPQPGAEEAPSSPAVFGGEGSEEKELGALLEGCGLVDASADELLAMTGEDRARFLNGQVTCDVASLGVGEGCYGFFTSGKGKVEFDLRLLASDDHLWLAVAPGQAEAVRERLAKYVIIDRVDFHTPDYRAIRLVGPSAASILAGLVGAAVDALPTTPWSHRELDVSGQKIRVVGEPELVVDTAGGDPTPVPRWTLFLPSGAHGPILDALLDAGAEPVGHRAWHRLRVAAGLPIYGVDFGPDCFPQETGLESSAVSYTKGCYLGQEVVARIHYRGGVRRAMRRIRVEGEVEPHAWRGADLFYLEGEGGKKVGTLSSLESWHNGALGLAIVRLEAEPGSAVRAQNSVGLDLGTATIEAIDPAAEEAGS